MPFRPKQPREDYTAELANPRVKPRGERIDYGASPLAKESHDRDDNFLVMVRGEMCAAYGNDCGGITESHHLVTGGKGRKIDDELTVPLCTNHHTVGPSAIHRVGLEYFEKLFGINLFKVNALIQTKYIKLLKRRLRG